MPIENFEQCLSRIMKKHNTNYSELSRVLNYRSKNTLHRILSGESGDKSRTKVFNDIANNINTVFDRYDIDDLEQALEVSRLGSERFEAIYEMRELMLKKSIDTKPITLRDVQNKNVTTLWEITSSLINNKNEIIIHNCCWNQVPICVKHLFDISPDTIVSHYITVTENTADTIRKVGSILPIVSYPKYKSYSLRKSELPQDIYDEYTDNVIIIRSIEENGRTHNYQIFMHNDHIGFVSKGNCDMYEYWTSREPTVSGFIRPIKTDYAQKNPTDAYLQFTDAYSKLENNSSIYTYKPDISFNFINSDITKAAFIDGLKQLGMYELYNDKFLKRLESIHSKRFNNIFTKKKVTQHVCSEKSLCEFAGSGILSDHFFVMRPYTIQERIEIFKYLLYQMENNPHFNIHLLKYDDIFINMEACCFEDSGVRFTPMTTNYNLLEGHSEAVVKQRDFIKLFIELFTGVLLKKYVKPRSDTLKCFKKIIEELEQELSTSSTK